MYVYTDSDDDTPYTVMFDKEHVNLHDVEAAGSPKFAKNRCQFCDDSDLTLITDQSTYDRDRFEAAMAAMQGLLANSRSTEMLKNNHVAISVSAVKMADALIAELQRPKQ